MRLIDADALMKALGINDMDCDKCNWCGSDGGCVRGGDFMDACAAIEDAPTIDPERKKKGRWVEVTDGTGIWKVCDQCGEKPLWNEWRTDRCESNFCHNCGAEMDMRGDSDEED